MNVKLLRKVKAHILAEPKRLYMSSYIKSEAHNMDIGHDYPKCGTAACIAGWACLLELKPKDPYEFWQTHSVGPEAAALLGIDDQAAYRLFEPSEWPKQFARGRSDDGAKETAKVAAARIEHFIKTKGRE